MLFTASQSNLTSKEYIAAERKATLKSEYLSGKIGAMSGASVEHNLISVNTVNGLYNQLTDISHNVVYTANNQCLEGIVL